MNLHNASYRPQPIPEARPYVFENVLGAGPNRSIRRRSPLRWFRILTFGLALTGLLAELISC